MGKKVIAVSFKTSDFGPVIFRTKDSVYHFYQFYGIMPDMGDEHHHLYYLSTDDIKKGDWGIQFDDLGVNPVNIFCWQSNTPPSPEVICHKIVASSDRRLNKEFNIPFIYEVDIKHYFYKNGDVENIILETEKVYVEPEGVHSNRGEFVTKLKLDKEGNVKLIGACIQTENHVDNYVSHEDRVTNGMMYQDEPKDHSLVSYMINHFPLVYKFIRWRYMKSIKK